MRNSLDIINKKTVMNTWIMDVSILEELVNEKIKKGSNIINIAITSNILPWVTPQTQMVVKFTVERPADNKDLCIYLGNMSVSGRGSKSHGDRVLVDYFEYLVNLGCVNSSLYNDLPKFKMNAIPISILVGVGTEQKGFNAQYVNIRHLYFCSSDNDSSEHIKVSTTDKACIHSEYRYPNSNRSNIKEAYSREYILFENAIYQKHTTKMYTNYYDYHNSYKGTNGSLDVLVTNIGNWVKVKELFPMEPALIDNHFPKDCAESGVADYLILKVGEELYFKTPLSYDNSRTEDKWGYLYSLDGKITFFSKNPRTSFTIKNLSEAKVAFDSDLEPISFYESNFKTEHLTSGRYISADISDKKYILAPVNIKSLLNIDIYKHRNLILYLYEDNLYGIIGEYSEVGIIYEYNHFRDIDFKIGVTPPNRFTHFFYSLDDLKIYYGKQGFKIPDNLNFHPADERFRSYRSDICVNDKVKMIKEIDDRSSVMGLVGVVTHISDNQQVFTMEFFGYFTQDIDRALVEKI